MTPAPASPATAASPAHLAERDIAGLLFVADMYGAQLDQVAAVLGVGDSRARAIAASWRRAGYAQSARLGPGGPWIWLTRAGLAACGLPFPANTPALSRLAHLRAVTAVRLALEATSGYRAVGAFWRSERRLRARVGGRVGLREHIPDGEVHWPDGAPVAWAGECWAVEAELTRKTVARTTAIMREILTRTGDYGCSAAQARVPGQPPRHARALYLCSPAAQPVVIRARDAIGALGARVEIRDLPAGAALPSAGSSRVGSSQAGLSRAGSPGARAPRDSSPSASSPRDSSPGAPSCAGGLSPAGPARDGRPGAGR